MKLRPLKYNELIAKLRRLGLEGPYGGGKHPFFLFGKKRIVVPNPHKGEVGKDIIKIIIGKIGISLEEFLRI